MTRFPTLRALAEAPLDDVLNHWAGLGYYARARNLHKAAQQVIENFDGDFPSDIAQLQQLSGIGKSTAAAIVSLAYEKPAAIMDGNVKRVLTRVFAIEGWPGKAEIENHLWWLAESLAPEQRCGDYTQAIMDLGATLCTRSKPRCTDCPLHALCKAFASNSQHQYPAPKPKKDMPEKHCWFLVIENNDQQLLLEQRPPTGIWGGLWSLPQIDKTDTTTDAIHYAQKLAKLHKAPESVEEYAPLRHTFSHYHLYIYPLKLCFAESTTGIRGSQNFRWNDYKQIKQLALPAPVTAFLKKAGYLETRPLAEISEV